MKRITLISLLLALGLGSFAQKSVIDSLKTVGKSSKGLALVDIYNTLSWEYKNSQLDSAKYYAFLALDEAKKLKNDRQNGMGSAFNSMANFYEAVGKMDSSEYYHLESLTMKKAVGDSIGMADSYNNLGILYDLTDRNDESVEMYVKSLRLYEKHKVDPFKIAMVYGNLGIVLKKLEQYDKALAYYKDALKIYDEQNSAFGQAVTSGNIGSLLIFVGEFDESIGYSQRAIQGYKTLGYDRYVPYSNHNVAIALDSLGRHLEAKKTYLEVIAQHNAFSNAMEASSAQNALANLHLKLKEYKEAKQVAEAAIVNATSVKASEFVTKATKTLASAEMGLRNFERAGQLFQAYIVGKDSLHKAEKTRQIFELQTKYETEKKERQLLEQESQLAEQKLVNQRNQVLLAGLGGVIILLIVIGIQAQSRLKWKNRQLLEEQKRLAREAEMNAVISSQEKERNRFARDLHDGFGQLISTLNLNLKNLESPKNKDEREKVFNASTAVLEEMYQELKNICFDLMPQTLIKHGLEPALNEFANRLMIAGKHRIEVNVFGLNERLTDLQEISLYRISQEWVNNILKYSDAQKIVIQITKDESEITLLIEDDGMGFEKEKLYAGTGNGWRNMTSRSNLIHGELELDTNLGKKGNTLIMNATLEPRKVSDLVLA
mgnify:CR=1 FL=1